MTPESTLSISAAARTEWDAVVIGAGPAGAFAARQLAYAARSVLLVEAKHFPRDKVCGGCLNGCALSALETAGLGHIAENSGGVPITAYQFHAADRSLRVSPGRATAILRREFDAALAAAAVEQGCHFLPATRAFLLPDAQGNTRELCLEQPEHRTTARVHARVVIIADGLGHSALSRTDEFRWTSAPCSRIGLSTIIPTATDLPPGQMRMAIGSAGYVGAVAVSVGAMNVAAAVDANQLRAGATPAAIVRRIFSEAQLAMCPALDDATWHGTGLLSQTAVRVAGHRVLLIGDAASYVEPFTGEGMGWALSSALASIPIALAGIEEWSPRLERQWLRMYRHNIANRQWLCRLLSSALRSPWLTERLLAAGGTFPSATACVSNRMNRPVFAGS